MYQIKPVRTKQEWEDFIDVAWSIYAGDPYWVPPLRLAVKDTLDVNKNPFFRHAYMHPVVAYDEKGECVGRIVGVIDDRHNKHANENTAFFGFFEAKKDQALADLLLNEVANWANERGMKNLRGPVSPSTNHECGLLVEGFEDSPTVMTTYNPQYYQELFENWGLKKSKDLFAFNIQGDAKFSEKLIAQAERLRQKAEVTFRTVNMKRFEEEIDTILEIYNDAWEDNWGFVPMDPEEFRHMAKEMKAIIDPELLLMIEVKGRVAGFGLALPDVNQAIKKIPNGRLMPTGLLKLLWNTKGPGKKKTMNRCRIITLGIRKEYRSLGLGPLLYLEYLKRGPGNGYPTGEASWILEDNVAMTRAAEHMAGKRSKVYRLYDRPVAVN